MIEFFNAKMHEAKLNTAPGNPVIAAQINLEQNFAFIEVIITWTVLCYLVVCINQWKSAPINLTCSQRGAVEVGGCGGHCPPIIG